MKYFIVPLCIVMILSVTAIAPRFVLAQDNPVGGDENPPGGDENPTCNTSRCDLPNPLGATTDISKLIEQIVRWLRNLAAPVAAAMVIWGAFQILFAGGDPEKFGTGKKTILYTVIGYAIIWIGWGIAKIIEQLLQ